MFQIYYISFAPTTLIFNKKIYMVFTYMLLAYGITNIVVYGSIFEPLRVWFAKNISFIGDLISCPLCFSTWVGFALSALLLMTGNPTPIAMYFGLNVWVTVFLDGCLTSGVVWLLFKLEDFLTGEEP
jgi:hypothetical protein